MGQCVLCKSKKIAPLYTVERFGHRFKVSKCRDCGLVLQDPMPKRVDALYDKEYFEGRGFDGTVDYTQESSRKDSWKEKFNELRLVYLSGLCDGKRLLDVGCAMGFFLSSAKRKRWDCYGVELSPHAADVAKRKIGAKKIFCGALKDAPFAKGSFDCITMFDVIEHLEDPLSAIKECYKLLRPGGIIVVETGNVDCLVAKVRKEKWGYFLYGHLCYFSRKTIRTALEKGGFSSVDIISGDEVGVWEKAMLMSTAYGKLRALVFNGVRKIGFGSFSVGGMVAIGRK